jgi:hypothetical protein
MTPEEQNLIENLFDRLREADVNPKDPEAERVKTARGCPALTGQVFRGSEFEVLSFTF